MLNVNRNAIYIEDEEYGGAPKPVGDSQRVAALNMCHILDTAPEPQFDEITTFVQKLLNVPIVAINLVDQDRQWFKSITGIKLQETPRNMSFCGYSILSPEHPFIVHDALYDKRFHDNPMVTSEPYIRFYAGFPLVLCDKAVIGTLCVIDYKPRSLTQAQIDTLSMMAKYASTLIDNRRSSHEWIEVDS